MINTLLFTTALILVKADVTETAPIDCKGDWIKDGQCSKTCGCGVQRSTYHISIESSNGGKSCEAKEGEMKGEPCRVKNCPVPVFGEWGECSAPCGEGTQTRKVTYKDTGDDWPNHENATRACNIGKCCQVGNFSEWGECSETCGPGKKTRSRVELTENGIGCPELQETVDCQIAECPIDNVAHKDTVCLKTELSSDLLGAESSCITADTSECLKTCKSIDACKGFDEKDGKCCFFSESLDEPKYEADSLSSCYILQKETAPETQPMDYFTLGGISASVLVSLALAFGVSKMFSGSPEVGVSKILATPLPRRNPASPVDAPNATPMQF